MSYTNGLDKPTDYFNTLTWTGDGASPKSITGVGFDPDFVWGKRRDDAAGHNLFDRVRGAGSTKNLQTNGTGAEGSGLPATYGYISAFATDGFTVTAGSTDNAYWNNNTATYVAWNWLAGGTAVSNTDGSITSSVSANTVSGFSIVTYTGTGSLATVGHGLGSAPKMVIAKNRGSTSNWDCYHVGLSGANYRVQLNSTGAESISGGSWGSTAPTSTVFTVQDDTATNINGNTYVAYCFAEKKGFSKFGKYTGNGSADGTFIYTGFKPAMIILKNASDTYNWEIRDNKRRTYNEANENRLFPNLSNAESVNTETIDFLSNGFKIRNAGGGDNGSGNTMIYMAFAESPFTTSTGIPTTAR